MLKGIMSQAWCSAGLCPKAQNRLPKKIKLLFLGPWTLSCLFGGCFFQGFWLGFPNPFQRFRFCGFLRSIIIFSIPFFILLTLGLFLGLSLWPWLSPSRCTFDVPQLRDYVMWQPWTEQKGSRMGYGMRWQVLLHYICQEAEIAQCSYSGSHHLWYIERSTPSQLSSTVQLPWGKDMTEFQQPSNWWQTNCWVKTANMQNKWHLKQTLIRSMARLLSRVQHHELGLLLGQGVICGIHILEDNAHLISDPRKDQGS